MSSLQGLSGHSSYDPAFVKSALKGIKVYEKLLRGLATDYIAPDCATEFMATWNARPQVRNAPKYGLTNLETRKKFRQIKTDLNAAIDRHINTFSIYPECQTAIENMQQKLPRELRDMVIRKSRSRALISTPTIPQPKQNFDSPKIRSAHVDIYKYLLQNDSELGNHTSAGFDVDQGSTTSQSRYPTTLLPKQDYAHLLLADDGDVTNFWEYQDTRRKFTHSWYRQTTFQFDTSNYIRSFSSVDRWGTGYTVPDLVSSVAFALAVEIPKTRTVDADLIAVYKRLLALQLEPLLKTKRLAYLELSIDHELFRNTHLMMGPRAPDEWSKVAIVEYLAAIFLDLTALLDAKCQVKIEVVGCAKFEVKKDELTVRHWVANIWGAQY